MLEVAWPAMLAVFSMAFEASEAPGAGPYMSMSNLNPKP
jgi:hypothetical protein